MNTTRWTLIPTGDDELYHLFNQNDQTYVGEEETYDTFT